MIAIQKNNALNLARLQSLIALVVLCIIIAILSDKFLTMDNGWNVLRQISVNICISVGMTLIVLTAGIDLSVGLGFGVMRRYYRRLVKKWHQTTELRSVHWFYPVGFFTGRYNCRRCAWACSMDL